MSRGNERLWLMPDVGDVLGDESLAESFDPFLSHVFADRQPLGSEEVEEVAGLRRRVMYVIDNGKPFMSLSPPPTHLFLVQGEKYRIHEESLEHWLSSSTSTLSFLAVGVKIRAQDMTHEEEVVQEHHVVPWLCNLLRNLPPSCHLRSLLLQSRYVNNIRSAAEMEKIVDAFCESPACKLDSLLLRCDQAYFALVNPQLYVSKLRRKCRSLWLLLYTEEKGDYANSLLDFMSLSTADCKLQELYVQKDGIKEKQFLENGTVLYTVSPTIKEDFFAEHVSVLKKVESSKLKRLDMRWLPPLGPDGMSLLVASVASPACCIQDLGICLSAIPHLNKTRFLILAQAFQCGSSLSKLKVLRFSGVDTDEAADCVLQILRSPQSNCKVRFLDIDIRSLRKPFFNRLLHQVAVVRPRIECLRVFLGNAMSTQRESELACLSYFLAEENCPLLWLQCDVYDWALSSHESLEMLVANALEANFILNSLHITPFRSLAAISRATAFLARNRLYRAMGLSSKEDLMKPNVARLFLCGHGEVGKTTLRKALIKLNHSHPASSPSGLPPAYHGCNFNMCFQPCKRTIQDVEQRTRGLEIHQLSFEPTQKLLMFDLGGQPDYHIFHHYFMSNASHDLFIIVSRYTSSTLPSQLASQLEYWLRFIVSHRNSVHGPKPRIMLVINFFHTTLSQEMQTTIAENLTQHLRQKYAEQLNFGGPTAHHVFGIVALNASQARPILERLKLLLEDLLNHKPMIPKLCNHLLSHTLPFFAKQNNPYRCGFGWRIHGAREDETTFKNVIVDYAEVKEFYVQQQVQGHQSTEGEISKLERRIQASLTELHNVGEVVFFPPNAEAEVAPIMLPDVSSIANSATSSLQRKGISPIIVDPNWFCNKVIGDLLASKALSGKPEWTEINIQQLLIKSGCPMHFVDEVLRYMISLDLCYKFNDNASEPNAMNTKFLFPAVASAKELYWPPNFKSHKASTQDNNSMHFYGRRIKCKETERHLIPSGVFARLQVKLQNFCGVGNYQGYKMGYHWSSFVKNNVGVMVRFGRVSPPIIEDSNTLPIDMEEDDHPEWIDILICCPSSQDARLQATSAEDAIMLHIRKLIFDICQATSRGIPTVVLEESALRHAAWEDVMPLVEIEACIRENGFARHVTWEDQETTCVVDLLLPEELQRHVASHIQAIQQIQEEFPASTLYIDGEGSFTSNNKEGESNELIYSQLHGEFKVLYDLINRNFERLGAKMDNVLDVVKEIKKDVHKVMHALQQAEVNIVAKCSTGLLEQLLIQGVLPTYSYLTDSDGKMQRLTKFFSGRRATVHFLCESLANGPHIVEGQAGKQVVVEKGILMKWAPFLIPSLMVFCCAARFAANAYLPGVAPLIFNPLLDCLKSIGITDNDLQSQIIPQALSALFDKLDVKIQGLYDQKTPFININEGQRKEGIDALQKILGSIEDLDVERDFGLQLVQVGQSQARWVCKEHARAHRMLKHPSNPFREIAKMQTMK